MFNRVDPGINQLIGSYLDYESRMNFGRVVPDIESRVVKKLDSDSHNTFVKRALLRDKVAHFKSAPPYSVEKCNALEKIFLYLLDTKDDTLFKCQDLVEAAKTAALYHTDIGAYGVVALRNRGEALSCMVAAVRLVLYLETKSPCKSSDKGQVVQIT
jgi:hypothetical protein